MRAIVLVLLGGQSGGAVLFPQGTPPALSALSGDGPAAVRLSVPRWLGRRVASRVPFGRTRRGEDRIGVWVVVPCMGSRGVRVVAVPRFTTRPLS